MKVLRKGKDTVAKIIGKKDISDTCRLSRYVYLYTNSGANLAKHIMTGEVVELTKEEFALLSELKDKVLSTDTVRVMGLNELIQKRYIVSADHNEIEHYKGVVSVMKILESGKHNGYTKYTILPTTGCNARCPYCFESGFVPQTMTEDTADSLVEYIMKTKDSGKIKLEWFGGEPFAAHRIITYICTRLNELGVEFSSCIVTNGSLITDELVETATSVWHLTRTQVSLDGNRIHYASRKAYPDSKSYTYDVVMDNILRLAKAGIKVVLRCNLDDGNLSGSDEFFEDIYGRFGQYHNVRMYLAPLHQELMGDDSTGLYRKLDDLYRKVHASGMKSLFSTPATRTGMHANYCFIDSMDRTIIIMPDGTFNNCENIPDGHNWGNVRDGVTDEALFKSLKAPAEIDDKCASCQFLPECTPTRKPRCPVTNEMCIECKIMDTEFDLDHVVVTETEDDTDSSEGDLC